MLRQAITDLCDMNQLADLLFGSTDAVIHLKTEHELATQAWLDDALYRSHLAQHCSTEKIEAIKNAWTYHGSGKLTRTDSDAAEHAAILFLPPLSNEQRIQLLQHYCDEKLHTHLLTIPEITINKALEWQSKYCAESTILSETISLLHRATNRFLLQHSENEQTMTLAPEHVAEVLVDWQQVNLNDLLRCSTESHALQTFLSENLIGQQTAIENFLRHQKTKRFFILAGPTYSGKNTFIENYARFTHGAKNFYVSFDLAYFSSNIEWSSVLLPTPHAHKHNSYLALTEIVQKYPQINIVLKNVTSNIPLLNRLQQEIQRGFFYVDHCRIAIEKISWMAILETKSTVRQNEAIQQPVFDIDNSIELSDILYRPSLEINEKTLESNDIDIAFVLDEAKRLLPDNIVNFSCILTFASLTERDQRQIIANEVKRIIYRLRANHNISLYYQEEVIQFLLNRAIKAGEGLDDIHKNLYGKIEKLFLKAIEQGLIINDQILMLQLSNTGKLLQIVKTSARPISQTTKLKI